MTKPAATANATLPPTRQAPIERSSGRVRLRTLVYIRWIAVIGQATSIVVVHFGLDFRLPLVPAIVLVAASIILNVVISASQSLSRRLGDREALGFLAYDILQLSALLYLTGGLQNPFAVLVLAPVIVSASVLSRRSTMILGLTAAAMLTALAFWHEPFPWKDGQFVLPDIYLTGIWEALILGIVFIAAYVGSVAEEARQMSDALAATQLALAREQRLSALGGLAAAAAHELGSPLATIAVVAKEMKHAVEPGTELADDVDLLLEQTNRCREILASLGREPETDPGAPFVTLPASALVEAAAAPYLSGETKVRTVIVTDATRSSEPSVARSPEILHGLGTVIENATQFAHNEAVIEVSWTDTSLTVTVRDDGPGFPSHVRDRIGEPYISSRPEEGHMGLGIFIASTLLQRTGAGVEFTNHPDGGAMVVIRWERSAIEAG